MTMTHGIIKVDDDLKKEYNFSTFRDDELLKRSNAIDDGANIEFTIATSSQRNKTNNKTETNVQCYVCTVQFSHKDNYFT